VTQLFFNIALVWTETVCHKIHVPCLPCFSDDCARKFPPDSAVISGIVTNAFSTGGWLHAKSTLVVVLTGLAHVDLRHLKRMVALRAEGKVAEAGQVKSKHLLFGSINILLTVIIIALVVMKPF